MEFSEEITSGLTCAEKADDLGELSSQCCEVLLGELDVSKVAMQGLDVITHKRVVAAMLAFFTEAAKTDATDDLIVSFLEGVEVDADVMLSAYKENKSSIRKKLANYNLNFRKLVDVYWRLSHRTSRSEANNIHTPMYTITLVFQGRAGEETKETFECGHSELQDFVESLRDAENAAKFNLKS